MMKRFLSINLNKSLVKVGVRPFFNMVVLSDKLKYTENDEWILPLDDVTHKIGISNYASDSLGELVYIEYNFEVGEEFDIDDDLVFIESVKAANSIKAPFNGTIIKNNADIENEGLHFINEDPECINVSWFCELEKKID